MVHHPTQSGALVRWINSEASNDESSNQSFQALPHHYQTRWTCVQRMAAAVGCTHVDATNTDAAINRTSNQCCKVLVTKVHCLSLNWVILQCITALNYSLVQCAVVVHQYGQYTSMDNALVWAMHQYGQCISITQHAATTLQHNLAKLAQGVKPQRRGCTGGSTRCKTQWVESRAKRREVAFRGQRQRPSWREAAADH